MHPPPRVLGPNYRPGRTPALPFVFIWRCKVTKKFSIMQIFLLKNPNYRKKILEYLEICTICLQYMYHFPHNSTLCIGGFCWHCLLFGVYQLYTCREHINMKIPVLEL